MDNALGISKLLNRTWKQFLVLMKWHLDHMKIVFTFVVYDINQGHLL